MPAKSLSAKPCAESKVKLRGGGSFHWQQHRFISHPSWMVDPDSNEFFSYSIIIKEKELIMRKCFTLIELLVVIAIIAILASLLP